MQQRIQRAAESVGRNPEDITLVAVTKTIPADRIRELLDLGIKHIGENRVQEAQAKIPELKSYNATSHLVGHLQSNKINKALSLFDMIQSVDSSRLAAAIQLRAERDNVVGVPCLVRVNVSGESTKHGIPLSQRWRQSEDSSV